MMLIGCAGRSRSGKSTVADQIEAMAKCAYSLSAKQYDVGSEVLSFCVRSGRLPNKKREDLQKHELEVLVYVGKQQREEDEFFWIKRIEQKIDNDGADVAIIPNVRFYNEIDFIRSRGGKIIRVTALTKYGTEWIGDDRNPNDISEVGISHVPADFYITALKGQGQLVRAMATNVFEEIVREMRE